MRYGSVCSGIEAASVAWRPLGFECAFVSEIEPFPTALLKHYYPDVPNLGDMTKITEADLERVGPIDLLVGGTPCQSFSVAGLRKGLADPRGNLALAFLGLLDRTRATWVVWENVPGVLSSNGGRDFGAFLGGLVELGYGFAYRVLDAQYFGLAQRRKRVFVVGHLGDWRRAAAVLLERESLSGHPAPRRTAGQGVAASLTRGADSSGKGGYAGRRREDDIKLAISDTLRGHQRPGSNSLGSSQDLETTTMVTHTLKGEGHNGSPEVDGNHILPIAGTLDASYGRLWGLDDQHINSGAPLFVLSEDPPEISKRLLAREGGSNDEEMTTMAVRRLMPVECERLQGFPDGYTLVPFRGKPAADGPRYQALGNSFAVPVVRWIGERIKSAGAL